MLFQEFRWSFCPVRLNLGHHQKWLNNNLRVNLSMDLYCSFYLYALNCKYFLRVGLLQVFLWRYQSYYNFLNSLSFIVVCFSLVFSATFLALVEVLWLAMLYILYLLYGAFFYILHHIYHQIVQLFFCGFSIGKKTIRIIFFIDIVQWWYFIILMNWVDFYPWSKVEWIFLYIGHF